MIYSNYMREKYRNTNIPMTAEGYPCILKKSKKGNLKELVIEGNTGKNLIPYPYTTLDGALVPTTQTKSGVTFTINEDRSITVNGTATSNIYYHITSPYGANVFNLPAKKYYFSDNCDKASAPKRFEVDVKKIVDGAINYVTALYGGAGALDLTGLDYNAVWVILNIPAGAVFDNVTYKPQLELGSTATEYEPYKAVGEASKNLMKYPYSFGTSVTHLGVTFTTDADGAVIITGKPTGAGVPQCNIDARNFLNILDSTKDYTLSGVVEPNYNSDGSYVPCQINMVFTNKGSFVKNIGPYRSSFSTKINLSKVTEEFTECHIQILVYGKIPDKVKVYPQIEEGTKRTEWCPNGKCYIIVKNDGENRDTVKTKIITDLPIGNNERLKVHDSDVKIPVFKGENIISTETTVQPKSLKAKYIKY